jgi:hypothetical protein
MRVCQNCKSYADPECTIYTRIPPATFALKCKRFIKDESKVYVPPAVEEAREPEEADCIECGYNSDGWCLRLDHPDFDYNYVKLKDNYKCPLLENLS